MPERCLLVIIERREGWIYSPLHKRSKSTTTEESVIAREQHHRDWALESYNNIATRASFGTSPKILNGWKQESAEWGIREVTVQSRWFRQKESPPPLTFQFQFYKSAFMSKFHPQSKRCSRKTCSSYIILTKKLGQIPSSRTLWTQKPLVFKNIMDRTQGRTARTFKFYLILCDVEDAQEHASLWWT